MGGLYVYNRQCHKAMKQAAVFPIEVQLSLQSLPSSASATATEEGEEREGEREREGEKGAEAVEDLLLHDSTDDDELLIQPKEDLLIPTD